MDDKQVKTAYEVYKELPFDFYPATLEKSDKPPPKVKPGDVIQISVIEILTVKELLETDEGTVIVAHDEDDEDSRVYEVFPHNIMKKYFKLELPNF